MYNTSEQQQSKTAYAVKNERDAGYMYQNYSSRNEYSNDYQGGSNYVDEEYDKMFYNRAQEGFVASQAQQAPERTVYAPQEAPSQVDYSNSDIIPSGTTMQYSEEERSKYEYEDFRAKREAEQDKQYKITTKGKILIAVYALVVATVFALIILNTQLLRTMNLQIDNKQAEIVNLTNQSVELTNELSYYQSDEVVEQAAKEMGMLKD